MSIADRLIVALDGDNAEMCQLMQQLYYDLGVKNFKVGPSLILEEAWNRKLSGLVWNLSQYPDAGLFLDLKLYDVRDTADRTVRQAFDLGARFVTVHATPSVMEAAMRAKPSDNRCKVLAVSRLTDQPPPWPQGDFGTNRPFWGTCDGIVVPTWAIRHVHPDDRGVLTIICPGIRQPKDYQQDDNHAVWAAPAEALRAGADYLVVGRPIWQAPDPVAAAKAIIAEMETAS